jgi:hypothetical protein
MSNDEQFYRRLEAAGMLAWLKQGSEIVFLADRPSIEKSEQVYEQRSFLFERRTWPDTTLISSCEVSLPWGAPENMLVSPHSNLVVLRWLTEGASGWEFVILSEAGDFQLQEAGFEIDGPAAIYVSPAFSPDGRYAVSGYHTKFVAEKGHSWPLQRGRYEVGCITVICIPEGTFHEIIISDAVPVKLHGTASQSLDVPVFLDNERFMTMLPTGAKRTFPVTAR